MALTFTIENRANLPDGGPLDMNVTGRRGIDIGRDQHLDWSLPDPARVVSSKHCEVRFRDGGYWLLDVSTNGTFLNGSQYRLQGPHRLRNGDRIEIGHYIIGVRLDEEGEDAPAPAAPMPVMGGDMWSGFASHSAPMPISSPPPPPSATMGQADPLDWFADLPTPDLPAPVALPRIDESWAKPLPPVAPMPSAPSAPHAAAQAPRPITVPPEALQALQDVAPESVAAPSPAMPFERTPRMASPDLDAGAERFLELVARGAGVPVDVFKQQSPERVAEILGSMVKATVDDLRALLQARAETKGLVRSTNQTMIQAFENNPMKFSPSTEEALRKMFAHGNRSYLPAVEAVEQSFNDLKTHQMNTYAAMQQALKMLIDDFDPAGFDKNTEKESGLGAMMSNRKAKLWDAFAAKWTAKAGRHDNGLMDVFMIYFSECYDRIASKLRK